MYPPAAIIPPRKGRSPLMGQYHYQPDGCHLYHAGNQFFNDHSNCTIREGGEKWNVLFLGDSHMRFVLHGWQYRLAGHTDYYPEKEKASRVISDTVFQMLMRHSFCSAGVEEERCGLQRL